MSKINLKTDYEDGNILHGDELNINNNVTMLGVNDNFDRITNLSKNKADIVYVDNNLSTKVDLATLNNRLREIDLVKADKSALVTKADKSEVNLKANQDYVDTQLETKADLNYVNYNLETKVDVDKYAVDINRKADKDTIGDLRLLKTEDKSSVVNAINSINTEAKAIATTEKAGIVKPDGTTITIDQDGTIHSVGGGPEPGGTSDYNELSNKPQINNVELKGTLSLEDIGAVGFIEFEDELAKKADVNNVYTKAQIDANIIPSIGAKADKSYVDSQLQTKADINSVYTKDVVDELINNETALTDNKLLGKADVGSVYTKGEVDSKVASKADNLSINENQLQLTSNGTPIGDPVTVSVSGNEVVVSPEQPEGDNWKIWIDSDEVQNLGSEVVDTLDGNETTKAPSVRAVKDALNNKPNIESSYSSSETNTYSCEYSNNTFMPKSSIKGITDMNSADACRVGIYTGNNVANAPTTGYVTWLTLAHDNNPIYCTQICAVLGASQLYVRYRRENTFNEWTTLIK